MALETDRYVAGTGTTAMAGTAIGLLGYYLLFGRGIGGGPLVPLGGHGGHNPVALEIENARLKTELENERLRGRIAGLEAKVHFVESCIQLTPALSTTPVLASGVNVPTTSSTTSTPA